MGGMQALSKWWRSLPTTSPTHHPTIPPTSTNPHTVTHAWYTHPPTLTAVEVLDSEHSTFILMPPRSELVDSTPPVPQLPLAS